MFGLFKPKAPTISMAEHVRIVVTKINEARKPLLDEVDRLRTDIAVLADINRATGDKLATFRAARDRSNANLRAANERRKAAKKAAELPDGLYEKDGYPHFDCGACGHATPWDGDISDFREGDCANLCGGSPRCCP